MGGFGGNNAGVSSRTSESTRNESRYVSADDEETTSIMDYHSNEHSCMEWTDEKHSMYLKSMEASFVDQLYNSFGFLESQSRLNVSNLKSSRQMRRDPEPPPGQFKVLHGSFWQGMDFQRHESQTNRNDKYLSSYREEVSDQNFLDEENKDGRGNSSKRMKMARNESMKDDQVVPHTGSAYGFENMQ